jgi:hypothetical protein
MFELNYHILQDGNLNIQINLEMQIYDEYLHDFSQDDIPDNF